MKLVGRVFKTTIYESVVGNIIIENEILGDGSIYSIMYVVYPDDLREQIFRVDDGFRLLELEFN